MLELSIIIPTLNESESIDPLFEQFLAILGSKTAELISYEIIVVDDQSTDETVSKALAWQNRLRVRVVQRTGKPDLSASVLEGADHAEGKWVVVMDADGSHPVQTIPQLIAPLKNDQADLVIGSRHVEGAKTLNWPWYRHLTSWFATALAWPFTEVKDPMAGFFATTPDRLRAVPKSAAGYKILLELIVQGGDHVRTTEVPICFLDRHHGESKLTQSQQLTYLKRLMNLGGGRISGHTASRFFSVGLIGLGIDLALFWLLIQWGQSVALAHIAGFAIATLTNFSLNHQWSFKGENQTNDATSKRYARFLVVALFAMLMRGGVLVALVNGLHWSALTAIIPAIGVTAIINYLGSAFFVFSTTESGVITRVRWHLAALGLFAYVFILRILYLGHLPLLPDEMYYWVYAQNIDLSYLDHPPLVGWLIASTTGLLGDHIFGVRASLIPLVLTGAYYFYRYGETMGGRTIGLLTMLALVTLPFFFLSGLVLTPDAPMIVAWAASLYYLKRLLVDDVPSAFWGLGLAMGLGLLAKYSIALLALGGVVFMLVDRRARRWFFRPHLYFAIALAFLIFSPVLIWNAQNDWLSFGFQFTRRLNENPDFSSHLLFLYAFALLSPVFAITAFLVMIRAGSWQLVNHRKYLFMLVLTLVPLSVFFSYGLFSVTKFHWTLPPWIALVPLVMQALMGEHLPGGQIRGKWHRVLTKTWGPSLLILVLCYGAFLHYLTLGLPSLPKRDFGTAYLGWPEITDTVELLAKEIESTTGKYPIVAATDKWGASAALSFHGSPKLRDNLTAQNIIGMSGSMWEFWFDDAQPTLRPVLLFHHKPELIQEPWIEGALIDVGPLEMAVIETADRGEFTVFFRRAAGFRREQLRTPTQHPPIP